MITEIPYGSHEEWLRIRNNYIGGSDAGAVLGMNPYSSPYELWAEKTGKVPPFEGNVATKVGSYLEDLVAKMFEEETGKRVRRKNRTVVNDKYPFAEANVDRMIVGEDAILEIKTTNSLDNMRLFKGGEYPAQWYCQMMHYMAVTETKKAYLAVLIGCREFKVFELERDEDEIAALMNAEKQFWEYVKNDVPPPTDGSEATTEALKTIYADESAGEDEIYLVGLDEHFDALDTIAAQMKNLEALKKEHENAIKAEMQEYPAGHSESYAVTWKTQTRKTFDAERFRTENPQISLDAYYKESASRVFRYKKLIKKEA